MKKLLIVIVLLLSIMACNIGGATNDPPVEFPTPTEGEAPTPAPVDEATETTAPVDEEVAPTNTTTPSEESGLPSGQLLYSTEFSNLTGWRHFPWWRSSIQALVDADFKPQIATYDAEIKKDEFHLVMPKRYSNIAAVYETDLGSPDVTINTQAEFALVRPWTFISLMCRYSDAGWYEFYIYADGLWGIMKITNTGGAYYEDKVMIEEETSLIINNDDNALNDITATCNGNLLTLSLNGTQLGSVQDDVHTDGFIGVGAGAGEQGNSQVDFMDLSVTVP
ncbi:MAG: hypothetical protein DWQ07_25175 [Chloroflexi bacterium]|nr:MAG: hypothetical protein DWQ07_25175 [Chloroflexota bacterium]MBL1196172.1 hypothetical protein [Chloroflexota bacterium]NOH13465.1 hypothetical protein [Chloroflexota bacterium]